MSLTLCTRIGFAALLLGAALTVRAQEPGVATIVFAQGVVSAQTGQEAARLLGKGSPLQEGDLVSTGRRAFTVIEYRDGGRMTLRPDTSLVIERFRHGAGEESALLRLVKGGLRAITGLLTKRNPGGMSITTVTATIGIRGTDFDARLCGGDCSEEQKGIAATAPVAARLAGRVALLQGTLAADGPVGGKRGIMTGGPVYPGDTLRTGAGSFAVIAFRDESRASLGPETSFRIEEFRYEPPANRPGAAVMRLIRGTLRAATGILARRDPGSVRYETVIATIGIRGTGLDASCVGRCAEGNRAPVERFAEPQAGDGLFVHAWLGVLELRYDEQIVRIDENEIRFLASGERTSVLLPVLPAFLRDQTVPRPDEVPIDMKALFATAEGDTAAPGLYVLVREGHVALQQDGRIVELGGGEAGYADPAGTRVERIIAPPEFLLLDRYPRPDELTDRVQRIIDLIRDDRPGARRENECEVR